MSDSAVGFQTSSPSCSEFIILVTTAWNNVVCVTDVTYGMTDPSLRGSQFVKEESWERVEKFLCHIFARKEIRKNVTRWLCWNDFNIFQKVFPNIYIHIVIYLTIGIQVKTEKMWNNLCRNVFIICILSYKFAQINESNNINKIDEKL